MPYESLLDKLKKGIVIRCPDCGSEKMKYLPHICMFGGYVCSGCGKMWPENDEKIKVQRKKTL